MIRLFFLFVCLSLIACAHVPKQEPISATSPIGKIPKEPLIKVNYIDHNGISETIVLAERLKQFATLPPCSPQSYKKLLRIYQKDDQGNSRSILTSYYDNGQIHQYLECINARACGPYVEWHENGQKKLESYVQAGIADLSDQSLISWSFHGDARAWDEKGNITAYCQYEGGKQSGVYCTYHINGTLASKSNWKSGKQVGLAYTYSEQGEIVEMTSYENGKRQGRAEGFHKGGYRAIEEWYDNDLLMKGTYTLADGTIVSSIEKGWGIRSLFEDGRLVTQHEVENGKPDGKFSIFDNQGRLEKTYYLRDGKKHGPETWMFSGSDQKKRTLHWVDNELGGLVHTWYPNGIMESSKEFCHNCKHGLSTGWYMDGSIMLVEEYQMDKLIRGKYHRKGSLEPISSIEKGSGIATLFDGSGNFLESITYRDSIPEI